MESANLSPEFLRFMTELTPSGDDPEDEDALEAQYQRDRQRVAELVSTPAATPMDVLHKLTIVVRRLSSGSDGFGELCPYEVQSLQLACSALADVAELLQEPLADVEPQRL